MYHLFWFSQMLRTEKKMTYLTNKEFAFFGEKIRRFVLGKFVQTCDELVKRFKQAYFTTYPGYYFTGDGAYRDKDGYYQITGRMDDVINVTGHRLGTAEVEDVLVSK